MRGNRAGHPASHPTSLRKEWSRAFTIMLAVPVVTTLAILLGVQALVGQFTATANGLDQQVTLISTLRTKLVAHETDAHSLLNGAPIDRAAFLRQQQDIGRLFTGQGLSKQDPYSAALLAQAATTWRASLREAGLFGAQVQTFRGPQDEYQTALGIAGDKVRAILDQMQQPALRSMKRNLAHDSALQRGLTAAAAGLLILTVAIVAFFRRRMRRDVLEPVASLHRGVLRLESGQYDHDIDASGGGELGELAQAFNSMAAALDDTYKTLTRQATHDSLTGLANRAVLSQRLTSVMEADGGAEAAVLFIDVDDFKDVNDSLGHESGDALLVQMSMRLAGCVRPYDLVGRLGGDEFAVVVTGEDADRQAVVVADRVLSVLRAPFAISGRQVAVTVSIGIAQRLPGVLGSAELLRRADYAMYMAKREGKARYEVYDNDDRPHPAPSR